MYQYETRIVHYEKIQQSFYSLLSWKERIQRSIGVFRLFDNQKMRKISLKKGTNCAKSNFVMYIQRFHLFCVEVCSNWTTESDESEQASS